MSSGDPGTRARILAAARELVEEHVGVPVSMSAIASRAGVSRQALYLHFADRAALLLELSRTGDAEHRAPERQRRIDEAATGRDALREAVALQAWLKPRLHGLATALDVQRRTDAAAQGAWQEREHARLERCTAVVRRLDTEGELADGWDVDTAARLMWAVTSQRVWDDLVRDQRWSSARYRDHVHGLLSRALLREIDP